MEKLNRDEIYLICMKLDCESILRLLSTNKKLYKMNLKDMWINKLDRFPNHKMKNYILLCQLEKFKEKFKFKKNIYEIYDSDKISLADIRMINPPKILNNLINLYHLDLSGNRLTEIPIIFNLLNLEILNLNFNLIRTIPKELFLLNNLEELYLNNNEIVDIPEEIKNLNKLKTLLLQWNNIENLKPLSKLNNLETLWINHNPVITFPVELISLKKLTIAFSRQQYNKLSDDDRIYLKKKGYRIN